MVEKGEEHPLRQWLTVTSGRSDRRYQLSGVDQKIAFVDESAEAVGYVVVTSLEDSSNLR
jgi:hypothetical protein